MKKRFLSILLTALLMISMVPTTAFAEGSDYTVLDGTDGFKNEGLSNLFDKSETTKWCAQFKGSAFVIFETAEAVNVSGYSFTTGDDNSKNHGRNPESWTLYGCNNYTGGDTDNWIKIHGVSNDEVLKDLDYETFGFVFDKAQTAYKYFKLEISQIEKGDIIQLSEFSLIDCDHKWSSKITEPTCTSEGYTTVSCSVCDGIKGIIDKKQQLSHDFSAEGKCIHCGLTEFEIKYNVYNISEGSVLIKTDDTDTEKLKIIYGSGLKREAVDPNYIITVWGETSSNELHVDTALPITIRAQNLTINSGSRNYCTAFVIEGAYTSADVTLILEGENNFTGGFSKAGIQVEKGRKLTITGDGSLNATGNKDGAGIGASSCGDCGTVVIESGTVNANATRGAGIGGGGGISSSSDGGKGGDIAIKGGTITAESELGAGIGGGAGNTGGDGGSVVIEGGNIKVRSSKQGAGIGGGTGLGLGDGSGGSVNISGGTVIATGVYGAGIGGAGKISGGKGGDVTITGGKVSAFTAYGDGIGGGYGERLNDGEGGVADGGSFKTGGGNAWIFSYDIGDQNGKATDAENPWSGVIFEYSKGGVYGEFIPLFESFTVEEFKTLSIGEGQSLVIPQGMILSNKGEIINNGKIYVDGTFSGEADNLYYPIKVSNAILEGDTSEYNGKLYAKAGSTLTLTPTDGKTGYSAVLNATDCPVTIDENNSFVMPSEAVSIDAGWKDAGAPTGIIRIGAIDFIAFHDNVTFDMFFKTAQEVVITAEDNSSDTVKIEYLLSANELSLDELDTLDFNEYTEAITISPDSEYVIYAKLTDESGNVAYINSTGIVLDATAPVISGIENGKTYCSAQTVTVIEEYLASVNVSGVEVTLDENNQFTRFPAESEQKIVVSDKAGNTAEMTVTINDGHTYEWQSENGQYWSKCTLCGDETAKKDIPTLTLDGADNVCRTQDYNFSFTLPEGVVSATYGYGFGNKGEGGLEPTIENGKMCAVIPADYYDANENSFKIFVQAETEDGFVFSVSKVITILPVGDIDGDSKITMQDVVILQKAIAKLVELTPEQEAAADVNKDTQITMVDVVLIQRYIAKLITSFDTVKS